LKVGYWSLKDLGAVREVEREFEPTLDSASTEKLLKRWHKAVERSKHWVDLDD